MRKWIFVVLCPFAILEGCFSVGCASLQNDQNLALVERAVQMVEQSDALMDVHVETQDGTAYAKQEFGLQVPAKITAHIMTHKPPIESEAAVEVPVDAAGEDPGGDAVAPEPQAATKEE